MGTYTDESPVLGTQRFNFFLSFSVVVDLHRIEAMAALRPMPRLLPTVLLSLLIFISRTVVAQIAPDSHWIEPDGSKADFSETYTTGDTITLSWGGLNKSMSDLWVTSWHPTENDFAIRIAG